MTAQKWMDARLREMGLVPVVKIDNAGDALPLADALSAGGLPCAEITFRTDAAADAIRSIRENRPGMLVGAGTVLTMEQLDRAIDAGAQFIVSPGLNPKIVEAALAKDIPVYPGCATPTEVEAAMELGLTTVKFFPAEAAGGIPMLSSLAAPYQSIKFMPTGGIDKSNMNKYLALPNVIACGGSFMVKSDWLKAGDWDAVRTETEAAVKTMLGLEMGHFAIMAKDKDDLTASSTALGEMLCLPANINPDGRGAMVGGAFEVLNSREEGLYPHAALLTNDPARAKAWFERRGYSFREETCQYDEKGSLKVAYFEGEWCGIRMHLLKKVQG
ncbi:MAG: bifunctional 4-hydroxy-2-oxoglutarate aldolase/2-dehydro-3-deoxy-phosphogluconate aldolase [Clostridia bacterium]|nr:bifunctional 4-hydroxy-2-oxoglutarate aldolase/2-dehydro-3-deoxy-phosphogluconate aldolase [Clostridia bacterium]